MAGFLLLLPPVIVTLCLDQSRHFFFPCMSRMDTTLRLCFVEGVARPGWRGVLFVGWSVGCLPLVRKKVRKIEQIQSSAFCVSAASGIVAFQ